jgi:uncharacterized membrane protein YfcA
VALAYTVQGVTGFAGNILLMPAGIQLVGLQETVAVANVMGFVACGALALRYIKDVNWREFARIIAVMTVFLFLGIWLDSVLPLDVLVRIYGAVIIFVALRSLLTRQQPDLPEWLLWIVLALAGIIQGMFVSGGAFLVIYAVQKLKDKHEFRITLSLVWTVLNGIYAAVAVWAGHFTPQTVELTLWCLPAALLATVAGNWLAKRLPQEKFLRVVYWLLLVMGALLLFA